MINWKQAILQDEEDIAYFSILQSLISWLYAINLYLGKIIPKQYSRDIKEKYISMSWFRPL